MARIQIPLDVITSRLNLGERFQGLRSGPLSGRFSNLRPISEFFDFKRVSKPANFPEMQSRVNYNLSHFSSNYAVVFVMLSIYALLSNWLLMFDIIFVVASMFIIGRLDGHDLEIGTFRATTSQLYTGMIVIAVPLGLIASPFSTLLWLIGASGVTILGGRPRAPEFAPPWGRPSRRRRRRNEGDAAPHGGYGGSDARVEELGTDEDETDSQGVGFTSGTVTRFVSDSLEFTGIDLGDRQRGTSRRGYRGGSDDEEEDDDEDEESSGDDGYEEELALLSPKDREEMLVQSALARIERARAKGRSDVELNKHELAALDRRRKRMEEEKQKKRAGGRKKRKEQRVAVPLTHLEPVSRKKKDSLPRHQSSSSNLGDNQDYQGYPPMGYFPPPSGSRSRPRSGTASSSQRPPSRARDDRGGNAFDFTQGPAPIPRHHSDSVAGHRSARGSPPDSRSGMDPFQFQTAGPRATRSKTAAASRRHAEDVYPARRGATAPASVRSGRGSGGRPSLDQETSEEDSEDSDDDGSGESSSEEQESSSDNTGNGAQIREASRGRGPAIVVEVDKEPEPRPQATKKSAAKNPSPSKRKPARGGRRRK
ncbi:hypothetical protein AK830_g1861 [Neonectria ditissima]|uniref:Prenylated Rab acceptor 1 n=1 Tax=Neonectria ditissima TaxID=78410 RepID=A0A0P7BD33_9HYPO|nr:hypothetical protein AK830_g1861 [Neonectria ditissima]